ncbi:MAG: rhodanese-like domain-containing protein [Syntrophorhabdaceae bacterium]|nr:rhodanese-like domain-containing protein [Syntrophorhabdaceae bacterium]
MVKGIDADEARKLLEQNPDINLIDVRQPEEYKEGHIPGATLIPLPELPDRLNEIDRDKTIVVYCRSGRRSLAASQLISNVIEKDIYNMEGGILAWSGLKSKGTIDEGIKIFAGVDDPEEIISLLYSLEEGSRDFYLSIADNFKEEDRKRIFIDLARDEEKHMGIISRWSKTKLPPREAMFMESGISVRDTIERVKKEGEGIIEILELSMGIEINGIDLCMLLLKKGNIGISREVLLKIIGEEKGHIRKLSKLITEGTGEPLPHFFEPKG